MPKTVSDVSDPLPPFECGEGRSPRGKALRAPLIVAFLALAVGAGCSSGGSFLPGGHARGTSNVAGALPGNVSGALPANSPTPAPASQASCNSPGYMQCQVMRNSNFAVAKSPQGGYTAAQLRSAYGLPPAANAAANGPLVAVVDAFEDPTAESDMNVYRSQFGLSACTTENGCFQKVMMLSHKQTAPGQVEKMLGTGLGATWADEIALDLAMVSAACPTCRIMLIEVAGSDLDSLAAGVSTAATYGPAAIAAPWGVAEAGNESGIDAGAQAAFNQPGIAITAAAGDTGAVQYPATSPYVTAVGGTTLTQGGGSRGWSESAWAGSGNGCSGMFAAPSWQTGSSACAGMRSVPDISMDADASTGAAVYSSVQGGWVVLGGTSIGTPFAAGLYAAAADYGAGTTGAPAIYAKLKSLNAVTGGGVSPNGLAGF